MKLPDLNNLKKLLIEKGIYESITAILDNTFMKNLVWGQLQDLLSNFRKNYSVLAERVKIITDENGLKLINIMMYIEEPEKREELKVRLLNTIEKVRSYDIAKAFLKEFEVKKIQCEIKDEWVELRIFANEKFADLVKRLGGDFVEEG